MKSKILLKYATVSAMALFLFTVASVTVNAEWNDSDEIVLHFSFGQPVITPVIIDNESYDRVIIEGLPSIGDIGVPVLPIKPVNVLLPQRGVVESIDVVCNGYVSLGDGFNVELGVEPEEIGSHPQNQSNISINYDVTVPYPTEICQNVGVYNFRGYSILTLNVYPVHYIGETGELYYYEEITVTIKTNRTGSVNPLFRGYHEDKTMVQLKIDDNRMLSTYVSRPSPLGSPIGGSSIVDPSEAYDYVIITSEDLKNANGDYTFQDLMNYKNERGTRTTIVTIGEIVNDPYYWNNTNHLFNDTQARIRNFITDAYLNWGTEYVLIGADADVFPVRYFRTQGIAIPSDLYYACLDGTFNSDFDIYWGELNDGFDINSNGDVDLRAEIYIGRAPVDNTEDLSNFIMKTLAYENTYDPYLEEAFFAGEKVGGLWMGEFLEKLINGSSASGYTTVGIPSDYNITRLYDLDWLENGWPEPDGNGGGGWPESMVIDRINKGSHIINHAGHSYYFLNMKMNIFDGDIDLLVNDQYCFIYSHGCMAGGFDNPLGYDCIAEHFTVKTEHGAFAGIWNAREGHTGPSYPFHREFWDAIFDESHNNSKMREIGVANQDSKEDSLWSGWLYEYYELNLFGDPEIAIKPAVVPEHDIAVKNIIIEDYKGIYVPSNETLTVHSYILNKGVNNEGNVRVNFTVDGIVIDDTYIDIERNSAALVSFDCMLPSGIHEISVEADPILGENITGNNNLNRVVIAGPDVALLDVDGSLPIYVDCSNEVLVTVGNLGVTDVSNVIVSLMVDSEVVNNTVISSISNGETITVSFNWIPEDSRWCNVSAFVEPVDDENYVLNNYHIITVHPVDHIVYVDDDNDVDFDSIQDAIDWVGEDDVVFVYNGTYHENIVVRKQIGLVGEDPENTIIDGCGGAYVVKVTADGVNLSGFTIQNNISSPTQCSGIDVQSDYNVIENNIITNSQNISNELDIGVLIVGNYNLVFRNTVCNIPIGICIVFNNNIISNNIISYAEGGIFVVSSFNNIAKNDILSNEMGIYVNNDENTISENNIENNEIGIKQTDGCNNVFVGNNISYNGEGINITCDDPSDISDNVFHHNNFINNYGFNAYDEGSNIWDDDNTYQHNEGNYWDDFEDNPGYPDYYDIPGGNNQDGFPLLDMCIVTDIKPERPCKPFMEPPLPSEFHVNELYTFTTSTVDLEGDDLFYLFDWDDGSNSGWLGPYDSGLECEAAHLWDQQRFYAIRVKSKDALGLESDWSHPRYIEIANRAPLPLAIPSGPTPAPNDIECMYSISTTDSDGDRLYYWFEWGDGLCTGWMGSYGSGEVASASHMWPQTEEYTITVKTKDDHGGETDWSESFVVTIKRRPNKPDKPSGPTAPRIYELCTYSTRTVDPDGDQVRYQWKWDWGQDPDEWTPELYDSNETIYQGHWWRLLGDYSIRVRAKDTDGDLFISGWSDPLPVAVPRVHFEINMVAMDVYVCVDVGQVGTVAVGLNDSDETISSCMWDLDNDGEFDDGEGDVVTCMWDIPGVYVVKARIIDDERNLYTMSKLVLVGDFE